ncbi:MAG: T9SS type A sorting domain-containing protein [Flavobacteriales bacterium]|nr:T9SS type A sorting domain-containing protein [Flavobacteriales bacterium]
MTRTLFSCLCSCFALFVEAQTWRKAYGAYGSEEAQAIRLAGEDLIVVAGSTGSGGTGASDIYLMALDGAGTRLWSTAIGSPAVEQAVDLRVLPDGSFLIAGNSNEGGDYDGLLVKTDPNGVVIWQRTYGGSDWDFFRELSVLPNGDLIIVGQTFQPSVDGEVWTMRLNDSGDVIEEHRYGGAGEQNGHSLCLTPDGFAIAGSSGIGDATNALLIRVDEEGGELWSMTYGGDSLDVAYDVVHTSDGGFSMVGITRSYSNFEEGYHLKTDGAGVLQWYRSWGQVNDQGSFEHLQLQNGEYLTAGYTKTSGGGERDMFLLKSAENGDFVYGRTFGGAADDVAFSLDTAGTGFLCAGWTDSYGAGGRDLFVVRTDENGTTASESVNESFDPVNIGVEIRTPPATIFPNPCTSTFTLRDIPPGTLAVFDAHGRLVLAEPWVVPGEPVPVALDAGLYVVEVRDARGGIQRLPLVIAAE